MTILANRDVPIRPRDCHVRSDQWPRVFAVLNQIAQGGICLETELTANLGWNRTAVFRATATLEREGYLFRQVLPLIRRWTVAVVRLTPQGIGLCRELGLSLVRTEWERLIRDHHGEAWQRHTAATLVFAHFARQCGYRVQVAPSPSLFTQPDVIIEKKGKRLEIEIEVLRHLKPRYSDMQGYYRYDPNWIRKYLNQYTQQGKVAFCTLTPTRRLRLSGELRRHWEGVATDLLTLSEQRRKKRLSDIWVERWNAYDLHSENMAK